MPQSDHADERGSATEAKFYLPAGVTPSADGSRVEDIWAALFSHGV